MTSKVERAPLVFGRTTFAEDIRNEASGQFTMVGVYPGGIHLPSFPATIAKFAFMVEFQQRTDASDEDVRLAAFAPGSEADQPVWEIILPAASFDAGPPEALVDDERKSTYPGELVHRQIQLVVMASLQIEQPGMFQIRAFRAGKIWGLGGLHFIRADQVPQP